MNRRYFYLAGCSMVFGDIVFMVSFIMTSWVEQESPLGDFRDGKVVTFGLWRTCVHDNLTEKVSCTGVRLSQGASGLMCVAMVGLLGSAVLYVVLWFKLHKFIVLSTISLHLLAGVTCAVALTLVAIKKRNMSIQDTGSDQEEIRNILAPTFWLATGATIIIFVTTTLICISIFIREPFPNVEEAQAPDPAPQPNAQRRTRPRNNDRNPFYNVYNSSRNSMISESPTDFSSSSFGSTSLLPSIGNGVDSSSLRTSSSLREAIGMSVSDFDIRARTAAVNLGAHFSDESLNADIEFTEMEPRNPGDRSSRWHNNRRNSVPSMLDPMGSRRGLSLGASAEFTKSDDVYTASTASLRVYDTDDSADECTVDRVILEDMCSRGRHQRVQNAIEDSRR